MLLACLLASVLVDRILAVVGQRPVMLSEARVLAEVRGLDERTALDALIDERLMFQEAARLPQAAVSDEEETKAVQPLRERHMRASEGDLRRLARRQLAILKYVDLRFRPQVRVTDEDVQEAWQRAYGGRPDAPPKEEVADALRAEVVVHRLDARVEQWVKELRQRADLRYIP
jgi:hypothetical protein